MVQKLKNDKSEMIHFCSQGLTCLFDGKCISSHSVLLV